MKKLLIFIGAIVLTVLLVACSGDDSDTYYVNQLNVYLEDTTTGKVIFDDQIDRVHLVDAYFRKESITLVDDKKYELDWRINNKFEILPGEYFIESGKMTFTEFDPSLFLAPFSELTKMIALNPGLVYDFIFEKVDDLILATTEFKLEHNQYLVKLEYTFLK